MATTMASVDFIPTAPKVIGELGRDNWILLHQQTVLGTIRREEPVITGQLRFSTVPLPAKPYGTNGWVIRFVARARYSLFVHEGRGWVYPIRAKALRWVSKSGAVVFAKRSRPSKPNRWFPRAFRSLGLRNVQEYPVTVNTTPRH
jgi:hypothetical protein